MFDISCDTSEYFANTLPKHNRQRIRHFRFVFRAVSGDEWERDTVPDSEIWTPVLGQLKTLRVFFRDSEPVDFPEGSMAEKWLGWINMLMEFIAERIPPSMCVELDDDSTP